MERISFQQFGVAFVVVQGNVSRTWFLKTNRNRILERQRRLPIGIAGAAALEVAGGGAEAGARQSSRASQQARKRRARLLPSIQRSSPKRENQSINPSRRESAASRASLANLFRIDNRPNPKLFRTRLSR
jgi:hypothetical protein